jgi:hypothetical protein
LTVSFGVPRWRWWVPRIVNLLADSAERLALIVCWQSPVGSEADVTWPGSALAWWSGGVVDEAGGAPLDVPLVALLPAWPRPTGVRLDGVEAALGDLDE